MSTQSTTRRSASILPVAVALLSGSLALFSGCRPQGAGMPPLLYRSSLLSYRLPQPLGFPTLSRGRPERPGPSQLATASSAGRRRRVVAIARRQIGRSQPGVASPGTSKKGPVDEGRFIARAYDSAGWELAGDDVVLTAREMYHLAEKDGYVRGPDDEVQPGDLAFFHFTRDANGNGKLDDRLTKVALVEKVDRDGTVHMLHLHRGVVHRLRANPARPHLRRKGRKVVNSYLRVPRKDDPPRTPYLAAEMLAGFATIIY